MSQNPTWYDNEIEEEDAPIREYDITSSPNDFNILTLFSFIESGAVKIPGFQRNFVWDITRSSRLIESLLIGLPIPQIFLYEEGRNKFLVIDGQQRLMSIYYFIKKRFPREEKRAELRQIFDVHGKIPPEILENDEYFSKFNLKLAHDSSGNTHNLASLNYDTLDDFKTQFDLRPIRNIIIKQNSPEGDDSSIYEIFNRLNSGGINLTPQEIRTSLYHSDFYDLLYKLNLLPKWRKLLGVHEPDLHMKDIEILLRGFAMLVEGEAYKASMKKFLNAYSRKAKLLKPEILSRMEAVFISFLEAASKLSEKPFHGKTTGRFNISIFDAVFSVAAKKMMKGESDTVLVINEQQLETLKEDEQFLRATQDATARKTNVSIRLKRAQEILCV